MSINKIVILKDALMIGEDRIAPPFKKEKIDAILGCPQKYQNETMQASNIYVWNDLGMGCCQTAHCGRYIPHFDFGAKPSPIVPYRHLPQSLSGMTADCRSLV